MTELYIDGQLAALPEGFNITFTSENPYFTRSSNYSLDIELPMACQSCHIQAREQTGCDEKKDYPSGHTHR